MTPDNTSNRQTNVIRNAIGFAISTGTPPEAVGEVLANLPDDEAGQVAYALGGFPDDNELIKEVGRQLKKK